MPFTSANLRLLAFGILLLVGLVSAGRLQEAPIQLGSGEHTYEWVRGWGQPPGGGSIGATHGCVAVDAQDRVFLNTNTEHAVVVLDRDGRFLFSWGKELGGGLHGMCLFEEDGEERLYLAHVGQHAVLKTTLEGEVLARLAWPEASGVYDSPEAYRPTGVAVAPNGDVYVTDGYGAGWIHRYSPEGTYRESFGGKGSEVGKFRIPHGITMDTRGTRPTLLVADRENHRLQSLDLDGQPLGVVANGLRRPCHVQFAGEDAVVADLAGRVTILAGDGQLRAHLGENPKSSLWGRNDIKRDAQRAGEFIAPHCAAWDSVGDLYISEWSAAGRIIKLKRIR